MPIRIYVNGSLYSDVPTPSRAHGIVLDYLKRFDGWPRDIKELEAMEPKKLGSEGEGLYMFGDEGDSVRVERISVEQYEPDPV